MDLPDLPLLEYSPSIGKYKVSIFTTRLDFTLPVISAVASTSCDSKHNCREENTNGAQLLMVPKNGWDDN